MRLLFFIVSLFVLSACSSKYANVESDVRKELSRYTEYYVIALQTGEVTLQMNVEYPHVKHPASGGVETGIDNVWLVNGGYLGEIYECRGCDSCMVCYQQAGLIDYEVKKREGATVKASVQLTPKGKKYLIENYVGSYSQLLEWRSRESIEMILVAKEKFDLDIELIGAKTYGCNAYRSLMLTPFLQAIGGTEKDITVDYVRKFRVEYNEKGEADIFRINVD